MLICRYLDEGVARHGRVDLAERRVGPVTRGPFGSWTTASGRDVPLGEVVLLPPAEPSKIVCLALNYATGAQGTVNSAAVRAGGSTTAPVLLKPPSSLAAGGDVVELPGEEWELKYEAELAVVIGTACKRVSARKALDVVAGYTCANDFTAYARRHPDDPATGFPRVWAKHFDGTTPIGPWLATDLDPAEFELRCAVDGETRQQATGRDLIRPIDEVIALVSEYMTLLPGDVLLTGTPAGSAAVAAGSEVEVSIGGIGVLRNFIGPPPGTTPAPDGPARGEKGIRDDEHRE
jgi:2-keto-4-pentenoate hydratase/2-oxohepta-3-ene-1,7-dioic acid hydratase in catechol pathway